MNTHTLKFAYDANAILSLVIFSFSEKTNSSDQKEFFAAFDMVT